MKRKLCLLCVFQIVFAACFLPGIARSQDLSPVKQAILEARDEKSLARGIEAAEELFLKEERFDDYVEFLSSLERGDGMGKALINFSIGQARLLQLKQIEESQQWEQYFTLGPGLRKEAVNSLGEALKTASAGDTVSVYANLVLWQYYKDQQDPEQERALAGLVKATKDFADSGVDAEPLKKTADALSGYNEKAKARQVYSLYFRKFSSSGMPEEKIFASAVSFLSEGNVDLAESAFDVYVEKISDYPKEKAIPALLDVARAISYKEGRAGDPEYAERMFAAVEAAGGREVFDEETMYLRAFNLEQGQELTRALEYYRLAAERFPEGRYRPEALFRSGIIAAYVKRDLTEARACFEKISGDKGGSYAVPALYQLGLFKHWENDVSGAREFYLAARQAGDAYPETATLAGQRLAEIDNGKELDFTLRTFLDNSLGESGGQLYMSKVWIKSPAQAAKGEEVAYSAGASPDPSGCTQVTLSYYWSGDLGGANPGNDQPGFSASYKEPGVKVVNLVVLSPVGAVDRAVRMVLIR